LSLIYPTPSFDFTTKNGLVKALGFFYFLVNVEVIVEIFGAWRIKLNSSRGAFIYF
jgi:hypothetical protein